MRLPSRCMLFSIFVIVTLADLETNTLATAVDEIQSVTQTISTVNFVPELLPSGLHADVQLSMAIKDSSPATIVADPTTEAPEVVDETFSTVEATETETTAATPSVVTEKEFILRDSLAVTVEALVESVTLASNFVADVVPVHEGAVTVSEGIEEITTSHPFEEVTTTTEATTTESTTTESTTTTTTTTTTIGPTTTTLPIIPSSTTEEALLNAGSYSDIYFNIDSMRAKVVAWRAFQEDINGRIFEGNWWIPIKILEGTANVVNGVQYEMKVLGGQSNCTQEMNIWDMAPERCSYMEGGRRATFNIITYEKNSKWTDYSPILSRSFSIKLKEVFPGEEV